MNMKHLTILKVMRRGSPGSKAVSTILKCLALFWLLCFVGQMVRMHRAPHTQEADEASIKNLIFTTKEAKTTKKPVFVKSKSQLKEKIKALDSKSFQLKLKNGKQTLNCGRPNCN